jgi:hypothetical protein
LQPGWLSPAAAWLAEAAPSWEDMTGSVPDERSFRLLVSSLHLEAWLICWPQGGRLALHDHGGASGAFQVVHGSLHEAYVDRKGKVHNRDLPPGARVAFDGQYIHDVVNQSPQAATSVHVYGAASRSMSFFQLHPSSREPLRLGPVAPAIALDETPTTVPESD